MTDPATGTPAIVVDGVSKSFRIPHEHVHTLKERALHPFRRVRLRRASRRCATSRSRSSAGEFFGIVGRNGSGKSTLLKCLAGIYRADSGAIYVNGRLSTFIELGVGFNPDLAARDNVLLNGDHARALAARGARALRRASSTSPSCSEFDDLKLKNYSSGMQVRLAFSVMIQVDADILLIDEVLAVGDAALPAEVLRRVRRAARRGQDDPVRHPRHGRGAALLRPRAAARARARSSRIGDPGEVADSYLELNFGAPAARTPRPARTAASGDGTARDPRGAGSRTSTASVRRPAPEPAVLVPRACEVHARGHESGASRRCSRTSTTSR